MDWAAKTTYNNYYTIYPSSQCAGCVFRIEKTRMQEIASFTRVLGYY